ncbi:hypothetical protein EV360DRAFT_82758 [Lentinula raphanica]|nr:hypothetical protein EV360DRAFT_82758 [Lentinula raphanica]
MYLLSRSLTSGFFQNYVLLSIFLAAFASVVTAIPIDTNNSEAQKASRRPRAKSQPTLSSDIESWLTSIVVYAYLTRYDSKGNQVKTLLLDRDDEHWGLAVGTLERRTEFLDDPNSPGKLTRRENSNSITPRNKGVVGIIWFKGEEPVESAMDRLFKGFMALPCGTNRFESDIQIKRYLEGSLVLKDFPLPELEFKPYPNDPWERIYRAMEGPEQYDVVTKDVKDWTKPAKYSRAWKTLQKKRNDYWLKLEKQKGKGKKPEGFLFEWDLQDPSEEIPTSHPPSVSVGSDLEASRILYHMANPDGSAPASGSRPAATGPQQRNVDPDTMGHSS